MKILICDDHKIVRDGLKQIIQAFERINTNNEAGNGN